MATMTKEHQFVPHGECTWVRLGGHIQTGGYSPCFSRAFGFLCDHITECTIYMAPKEVGEEPQKVIVTKPTEEKKGDKNFDLWWAILGGSPGNFGIITEIKIKGIKDADHPHVHAMTIACHYTKKTFQHFMEIMAEYNDDDNLPADFTFNVLMLEGMSFTKDRRG
jgi:FAD/FMN-containing dehydrogenase